MHGTDGPPGQQESSLWHWHHPNKQRHIALKTPCPSLACWHKLKAPWCVPHAPRHTVLKHAMQPLLAQAGTPVWYPSHTLHATLWMKHHYYCITCKCLTHAVAHRAHDCHAHSAAHTEKDGVLKYAPTMQQGTWPLPRSPAACPKMPPPQSCLPPPPAVRLAGEQAYCLQTTSNSQAVSWPIAWPAKQLVTLPATHPDEWYCLVAVQARCDDIATGWSAAAPPE
jgi:hypothetical protein